MANRSLFSNQQTSVNKPATDTVNEAGGVAYQRGPKEALAQLAVTGCFNQTFYTDGTEQLDQVLQAAMACEPAFVAKVAIYARHKGFMKDMPAALVAHLATRDSEIFRDTFPKVIDNGKMIRNFVQIVRSGVLGRKSLGHAPKRMVREWLQGQSVERLFWNSTGNNPSMGDVIRLSHPKPGEGEQEAMFERLMGYDSHKENLPPFIHTYDAFRADPLGKMLPKRVPFEMLTGLKLSEQQWRDLARQATWQQARMSLNKFQKQGILDKDGFTGELARKLENPEAILKARAMPYQLLAAFKHADKVPTKIKLALQAALEVATRNVPKIDGKVFVCVDCSGSMGAAITGKRKGATSKVQCLDVAALFAAAIVRKNPEAVVLPFHEHVVEFEFNPLDSVMTITDQISQLPSGGTNCSAPMRRIADQVSREKGPVSVIFVSDYESWMDSKGNTRPGWYSARSTGMMEEWERIQRATGRKSKLACIDVTPHTTTQAINRPDIINVGGFNDSVFSVISAFLNSSKDWTTIIEEFALS